MVGLIALSEALFVLFVFLKLVGVITWSWIWVVSPIWMLFVIYTINYLIYRIEE